jgi:hypothetical protein
MKFSIMSLSIMTFSKCDTQHNGSVVMLSVIYLEYNLCWFSFKLSIVNKPILPRVLMLNVIILSVTILIVMVPLFDVLGHFTFQAHPKWTLIICFSLTNHQWVTFTSEDLPVWPGLFMIPLEPNGSYNPTSNKGVSIGK